MHDDSEDSVMILEAVERFAAERIAPLAVRHETPLDHDALAALAQEVTELGILPCEGEPGQGLWEGSDDAQARVLSIGMLRLLSKANTGLAWQLHQRALTLWLARRLGVPGNGLMIATQGRFGLGRHALGRYLGGHQLDTEAQHMLGDCYGPAGGPRLLVAADSWQRALLPLWNGDGMQWGCSERGEASAEALHGLDELGGVLIVQRGDALSCCSTLPAAQACALMGATMSLQWLGQLAVARGSLARSLILAEDYAAQRRQAGVVIQAHPAVQGMLEHARAALEAADAWLAQLAHEPPELPRSVQAVARARAQLHPMLCTAANQCLQVLGGSGYMRDTGLEKVVRDNNVLRLLNGTPTELQLFAHGMSI